MLGEARLSEKKKKKNPKPSLSKYMKGDNNKIVKQ